VQLTLDSWTEACHKITDRIAINDKSLAVAEMGDRGHNRHGPKRGGLLCPFHGGAGFPFSTMWLGPRSTSFGRNRYGQNIGGCAPFGEGELDLHLTQCGQGRGVPACQVSS